MFRVIDTVPLFPFSGPSASFELPRWEAYMDAALPGAKELCLRDMRECVAAGYPWETAFLPVLNAAVRDSDARQKTVEAFHHAADSLERRLCSKFGRAPDVDLVLYLGLCSGAGWATEVDGRPAVLLGIEKIMELGWYGLADMNALILHELGHLYHFQFGTDLRALRATPDALLWQLFSEGVAMVFEQDALGDPDYYHQDKGGWKAWCDAHCAMIAARFAADLGRMGPAEQNYFGDWVRFNGQPDVGYYLGARFLRFILSYDSFDRAIRYGAEDIRAAFGRFVRSLA